MGNPPYGMLAPRGARMVDGQGYVTREWWRWFESIFQDVGAGQASVDLASLANLQFLNHPSQGPDLAAEFDELSAGLVSYRPADGAARDAQRAADDARTSIALIGNPAGAIAGLTARISSIEGALAGRLFGSLAEGTGGTAGVTNIVAGYGLAGGTITTSGTISIGTIAADSLWGNGATIAALPTSIAVGSGLTITAGNTIQATPGVSDTVINTFTIAGTTTYSKPSWANVIIDVALGAGGGGGAGVGGAASTNRQAGTGGGGGARSVGVFRAGDIANTVTLTIGSGGTGGVGASGQGTSPAGGGASTFDGNRVFAGGGGAGFSPSNTNTNTSGGSGGGSIGNGNAGGTGNTLGGLPSEGSGVGISGQGAGCLAGFDNGSPAEHGGGAGGGASNSSGGAAGGSSIDGCGGGGAGQAITNANSLEGGGAGGGINAYTTGGGGAFNAGTIGSNGPSGDSSHGGGGGGGGAANASGTGFQGGNGGGPGGGGGGGGGGTTTGGSGGKGADGAHYVIAF